MILLLFVVYFSVNCWRFKHGLEEADYCGGSVGQVQEDGTFFTSEIMATGYGIVALTLMVTIPAFKCIRKRIPYGERRRRKRQRDSEDRCGAVATRPSYVDDEAIIVLM